MKESYSNTCIFCGGNCIKKGKRNSKQRLLCKNCNKYQISTYEKARISKSKKELLLKLNNEGVGISSISRILNISKSSVQRIILNLNESIIIPELSERNQIYEIDELRTYEGSKKNESWVIYAINKTTGKVINLVVGKRTKENIKKVVERILALKPLKIYTDGLNIYRSLIPKRIHKVLSIATIKLKGTILL